MMIQTLRTQPPIEDLGVGIIGRCVGSNERQLEPMAVRPVVERQQPAPQCRGSSAATAASYREGDMGQVGRMPIRLMSSSLVRLPQTRESRPSFISRR